MYAADLIARAAPLDIGGCLTRSWNLLKGNFWPLVGVNFVVLAATVVVNSIPVVGSWLVCCWPACFTAASISTT